MENVPADATSDCRPNGRMPVKHADVPARCATDAAGYETKPWLPMPKHVAKVFHLLSLTLELSGGEAVRLE